MKITKEERNLCKQIAEKYRKPFKNFDLVVGTHLSGEEFVGYFHEELTKERLPKTRLDEVMVGLCETARSTKELIPLWTISDCLEFLRERGWIGKLSFIKNKANFRIYLPLNGHIWGEGKTPLEACLKVVIEVLKNEKL